MNADSGPLARQLVFAGGGHSHALALRMLAMKPLPGVRVTLVSDVSAAPYSGMLPGHIAGAWSREEIHIDLRRLCQAAGAVFVQAKVTGIDPAGKRLLLEGRPALSYDMLSLNTGSTPVVSMVPGAELFAIPSKPVPRLLAGWEEICQAALRNPLRIVIVGGGAGGVELALSMQARLGGRGAFTVIHRGRQILDTHNARVRSIMTRLLAERGIRVLTGTEVSEVRRDSVVLRGTGETEPSDYTLWVTQAAPAPWIRASGLAVDEGGFLKVTECLQSVSHPDIFAAGDAAAMPRPLLRSGVYAVRMARPLLYNLRQRMAGRPLRPYRPQRFFLSLVGTADGRAVASRRYLAAHSSVFRRLKDWIDCRFMEQFSRLPAMFPEASAESGADELTELRNRARLRCTGCAAKVGSTVLTAVMDRLRESFPGVITAQPDGSGIQTGLATPDDAAVFTVPPGRSLVQTVDYMPSLTGDPLLFGKIAALHSFSDIFAMGAEPHSCLAAAMLPFASEEVTAELLFQLLSGVASVLQGCGAALIGGHTAEGNPAGLALTCNGLALPESLLHKGGLRAGDRLILTKPLGTGTLFAAEMRLRSKASWMDAALTSMLISNLPASRILRAHHATACTDVTGFGLAGHLLEMLRASRAGATVFLDRIPALMGAEETLAAGVFSSLYSQNARAMQFMENPEASASHARFPLLFDPQTSGGLLAGVGERDAAACVSALRGGGCPDAEIVGVVSEDRNDGPVLRIQRNQ